MRSKNSKTGISLITYYSFYKLFKICINILYFNRYLEKEFSKSSSSKQSCSQVISNAEDEFLNAEDFVLTGFIASIDVVCISNIHFNNVSYMSFLHTYL